MALMVVSSIDAAWQPSSVDPPSHIPAKAATLLQNSIPSLQALSHTTSINSLSTLNKTCHLKSLQPNFYLIEEAQSPTTYFSPSSHFQLCIFFSSSFGCWRLNSLPLKTCFMKHLYKLKLSKKKKQYDNDIQLILRKYIYGNWIRSILCIYIYASLTSLKESRHLQFSHLAALRYIIKSPSPTENGRQRSSSHLSGFSGIWLGRTSRLNSGSRACKNNQIKNMHVLKSDDQFKY